VADSRGGCRIPGHLAADGDGDGAAQAGRSAPGRPVQAACLTAQQPALFQPTADSVYVWKKTLSGPPGSFASLTQFYLTPEFWYFTR